MINYKTAIKLFTVFHTKHLQFHNHELKGMTDICFAGQLASHIWVTIISARVRIELNVPVHICYVIFHIYNKNV